MTNTTGMANTIRANTFDATKANKAPKLLLSTVLLSGVLGLSACQEADNANNTAVNSESNNTATTTASSSDSADSIADNTTATNTTTATADNQPLDPDYEAESVKVIDVETIDQSQSDPEGVSATSQQPPSATNSTVQDATATKNSVPSSEIQVTDVEYQDSKGRSIYVTFKTSATSTLQADLRLPNGKRVLLTAPTGQGNNPIYHSTDGSIELVTHGGGTSMDLFYNNKRTKFEAIETEAEVLKPQ